MALAAISASLLGDGLTEDLCVETPQVQFERLYLFQLMTLLEVSAIPSFAS